MDINSDWKGLFELLNDLIRKEDFLELEAELIDNIDKVIPADRGAPFFKYTDRPICIRWPEYADPKIPIFNSHFNEVCPAAFNMENMMLGPVVWKKFRDSEYDTDFNVPMDIGYSLGCGFPRFHENFFHIIVLNRSRKSRPFSRDDVRNLKFITGLFSTLYNQKIYSAHEKSQEILNICLCRKADSLSFRETEVCRLLYRGLTAKEIAHLLLISPRTVERHCLHIYQKLRVRNRKELIALLYTDGGF